MLGKGLGRLASPRDLPHFLLETLSGHVPYYSDVPHHDYLHADAKMSQDLPRIYQLKKIKYAPRGPARRRETKGATLSSYDYCCRRGYDANRMQLECLATRPRMA